MNFKETNVFTEHTLRELIEIPSVSGNEGTIGNYIFESLQSFGVDSIIRQHVGPGRFNVVATLKGSKPGPRILLTGHMDTVPAGEGWDTDPFEAVVKDDRMYGRGALDMKGGIAAILNTVRIAAKHRDELPGELLIAFVPDEEAFSAGVNKFIESGVTADFGIAAEPEYKAVIGSVGKMLIRAQVKGVAAHGCEPELGINAVEESAKFLSALGTIPLLTHPVMKEQPYVTLKIEGGFKEYSIVVPENCEFLINKHTVPAETKEYVLGELEKLVERLNVKAQFEFSIQEPYYPAFDLGDSNPYLSKLGDIYKEVIGTPMEMRYGTGVSDNNRLVPLTGIPVICLGAYGGGLHSKNEWVSISALHRMSLIYQKFIFNN
ncbi:M20/M25/M40 family metallo-hydrolase [Petroclostridium sp. X23]|uniref:M20 family metallopeptidase n=1 Tax=Petroclostridium sp. X23 TaxID=3045146 RepID=UPI0024AE4459|nr:M20/M25/M40 family metallo-hydrolase [Petroclostridium sp. X23]WHH61267.1 M20/M25/M40 family metallo-hydrolase [Petroclostridium sp. X23]